MPGQDKNSSRTPAYEILRADELALIEKNTDYILENIGIDLHDDPISIETLKTLGATVDGIRVKVSGKTLRDYIKTHAPSAFKWRGKTSDKDVIMGGAEQIFAPVYGPPEIHHGEAKIAPEKEAHKYKNTRSTLSDYRQLVTLCDQSKSMQTTGFMLCFLNDVEESQRPIEMAKAHLELSDKPFMGTVVSEEGLKTVIEMVGRETSQNKCNLLHMINPSPPLRYQENSLKCLRAAAAAGEGVMITSYSMMGATSPVTVAGVIAQGYAEVLMGLALSQLYKPGCPVVASIFGIPFSMSSMIPTFGMYNSSLVQLISSQLIHGLGIPCRGEGGITSSKLDDAQAGYEGGMTLSAAMSSNADFVMHTGGWLLNGICTSPSKLVRESEALDELLKGTLPLFE